MKIRNGFVSNSSSSSFLIYGVKMSKDASNDADMDLKKLIEKMGDEKISQMQGGWTSDIVDAIADRLDLNWECGEDDEYIYFGRDPESLGDDETGSRFKESVRSRLVKVFGEDVVCGWHSEAWWNG